MESDYKNKHWRAAKLAAKNLIIVLSKKFARIFRIIKFQREKQWSRGQFEQNLF